MRIALGIEYNGAQYCGWQSQPSGCGVQDHVEAALSRFVASAATGIWGYLSFTALVTLCLLAIAVAAQLLAGIRGVELALWTVASHPKQAN